MLSKNLNINGILRVIPKVKMEENSQNYVKKTANAAKLRKYWNKYNKRM